ncbi:MAG: LysM peptidoglycan-binding domain-containing protein [Planctomycetota bacterium]
MGQLERYGLYVLCLVIVLILGVAIWGGDPAHGKVSDGAHGLSTSVTETLGGELGSATPVAAVPSAETNPDDFFAPMVLEEEPMLGTPVVSDAAAATTPAIPAPTSVAVVPTASPTVLRTYTVQRGDTFESIAIKVLKGRKHMAELQRLNPDVKPKKMRPGHVLKLPVLSAPGSTDAAATRPASWREYVVKKGDNAWDIADAVYGKPELAAHILQANGINDPKKLKVNQRLKIPPRP